MKRNNVPFWPLLITLWEQGVAGSNPAAPTDPASLIEPTYWLGI
jgi:hypothetical protein